MKIILAFLVSLIAFPALAQECLTRQDALNRFESHIDSKEFEAAVVFDMKQTGVDALAAVVIVDKKFLLMITEFENGCVKKIDAQGNDMVIGEFNPDMLEFLSKGEVIFEGGKIPSFLEFKT